MKLWLVCACAFLLAFGPVAGQSNGGAKAASPEDGDIDTFVLGNMVFWLYREMGHVLEHILDLPVVGSEEDAMDGFATVRMIANASGSGSDALLVAAARAWRLIDQLGKEEKELWDVYSLSLQRHYSIVCQLVGSDPEGRRQFAIDAGMPEERIAECPGEYESMREGWERLLAPHSPNASVAASSLRFRQSGDIKVVYDRPLRKGYDKLRTLLKESGLMEAVVEDVQSLVELPENIKVRFTDCKSFVNFYKATLEVEVCYNLPAMALSLVKTDTDKWSASSAGDEVAVFFPDLTFDEEEVALFVLGNTQFAVYRELAKALIHDLDLPLVVGESKAADSFAAVFMIPEGPNDPLGDELVIQAAEGWYLTGLEVEEGGEVMAWSGDDLSLQRYYDVICLFVGSDLAGLRNFGKMSGLGRRIRGCENEFSEAVNGWTELLEPHIPSGVNGSGAIDVVFEKASVEGDKNLTDLVRDNGVVKAAVDNVLSSVDLPRGLQVVIKGCEDEVVGDETFFDADGGRVVVCHKFLVRLDALIRASIAEGYDR